MSFGAAGGPVDMNDHVVQANGVGICVESFGDPADPAIVLSHGAGNSMLSWDEQLCQRLAAGGRRVVRYDIRDAGRSVTYPPGPPPYGMRDLVADAVGILDALGLETAHFVGLSQGGAIGQLLALDHPDRVTTLTLVASTPGAPGHEGSGLPGVTDELGAFFADEPPPPDWTDRAAVIEYIVESERPFAARFDEAAMRDLAGRVFDRSADIEASLTNVFAMDPGEPWRARLGELTVPTLILHGTEDPMFRFAHAEALADEIPGAELIGLEPMGHEYLPPATWDVVVPAILRHTAAG
jgi:pimeloyl-ACP methyl ester carboxylesterase